MSMTRRIGIFSSLIGWLIIFLSANGSVWAQAPAKASCVTSSCHANMGKDKFVHGPVAVNDCLICHKETDKHKFLPIKDVGALCYSCHDPVDTKKAVHKPVKDGNCTLCHSPHQAPNKFMLRSAGVDLCFTCHSRKLVAGKFLHGPVAVGDCTACHSVHQSDFPRLLQAEMSDVCYSCHADKKEDFGKKKVVHKPVKESCVGCHTVHSSDHAPQLKNEATGALCFDCHKEMKASIAKRKVPHKALGLQKGCLECHNAHATNFPMLQGDEPMNACFKCHDKTYGSGKKAVANIKEIVEAGKFKHGPVMDKDCSSCHDTHGSDYFRILRSNFPPLFYAPFNEDNYGLCFTCHQKTLVEDSKTTTLTEFRNGDRNLHFVHVNKADKGRTCRACHEAHANNNPRHVRDAVPFGGWKIPINFKKMPDGGTCLPGCHAEYPYNRVKPVQYR